MTTFFDTLAGKLAERWLAALTVPGSVFLGAVWLASSLGQRHPLDFGQLTSAADRARENFSHWSATQQIFALTVAILAATILGRLIQAMAVSVTMALWLDQTERIPGLRLLARRRANRLRSRWTMAVGTLNQPHTADLSQLGRIASEWRIGRRRNDSGGKVRRARLTALRIGYLPPRRATFMGNRMDGLQRLLADHYDIDLAWVWPRLWLLLPDTACENLASAYASFSAAAVRATWGVPWILLGVRWWPAFLVGTVLGVSGWWSARDAIETLAQLAESAVDVHGPTLALHVGLTDHLQPLTPEIGAQLSDIARKNR